MKHPAELIEVSPEATEIANCFLRLQDIDKVCAELNISKVVVLDELAKPHVKTYIDSVFMNVGFNNRFTVRTAMDAIIRKKFEEMDAAGIGSSKDIADLLALSHKMTMDILDREIALEKLKQSNVKTQTNIQINGGNNYANLIERLITRNDSSLQ